MQNNSSDNESKKKEKKNRLFQFRRLGDAMRESALSPTRPLILTTLDGQVGPGQKMATKHVVLAEC